MVQETKGKEQWLTLSLAQIRKACTPFGITASLEDSENYGAIFSRDAVMAGLAGVIHTDEVIIEGLINTITNMTKLQGEHGQIPSNFHVKNGEVDTVSFGTLSPKIDAITWYLIGLGVLIKNGHLEKEKHLCAAEKAINLLEAIEYNGKGLVYVPKGGNWADEYVYEGYVLYDQLLRVWSLQLLSQVYGRLDWSTKADEIIGVIKMQFILEDKAYLASSVYPGGKFDYFDLAAHTIGGLVLGDTFAPLKKALDWMKSEFLEQNKLVPAFYPVIEEGNPHWDDLQGYHLYRFKNKPHHFHNGGIWWIWQGWLALALSNSNDEEGVNALQRKAFNTLNSLEDSFEFHEYLSGDTGTPEGVKDLAFTATGISFLSIANDKTKLNNIIPNSDTLIKENFVLKPQYFELSSQIIEEVNRREILNGSKKVIAVGGESGSGKSVTAICLKKELEKAGVPVVIIHQDSYFKLPPKDNHSKRMEDIAWVGSNEVNMELMQSHIDTFLNHGEEIKVPVVNYESNQFSSEQVSIKEKTVLIVEGVYSFLLANLDFKIFMARTYKDSLENRKNRSREEYSPFAEKVLAIEQKIVLPLKDKADIIVNRDYTLGVIS